MRKGFWQKLKKPIMALAPMANVTDAAFRRMIAKYGKPDVMWTEFVSADGLTSSGKDRLLPDLWFVKKERPIVAQLFTAHPEKMREAATLAEQLGFDGIDINMGCPDRAVERQGAGAALIKNPTLAQHIIRAAQAGAPTLPVSVKTRIGYTRETLDEWLPYLLEMAPAAVTIHGRTRNELSNVPARWDTIEKAAHIIKSFYGNDERPIILGNGDVETVAEGIQNISMYGVDGVMIGRGIFGNPWCFSKNGDAPSHKDKLEAMIEHTKLFEQLFSGIKSFDVMKKHYKAYVTGFEGSKELRMQLMNSENAAEVEKCVRAFLDQSPQEVS